MENEQIKQKIEAETLALMSLKVDNEELVKFKFKTIRDRLDQLHSTLPEEKESYDQAVRLMEEAINTDYKQFSDSLIHDEKDQALIQLKHKAAEVCELLKAH